MPDEGKLSRLLSLRRRKKTIVGKDTDMNANGYMGTADKEHAEHDPASQIREHPVLHSQISQGGISISFYRCQMVRDHERRGVQTITSRATRSSAPFQLVEQVEGDSKILLLPIMDHSSEAEAFAIRIGLEPEFFKNTAGEFERYVCKVEIKLGGVNIAAPIGGTLTQSYFILYGGHHIWIDGVALPNTQDTIRQFVSAKPEIRSDDHSVVKRFRGTRDEYDEFELEAQMGHRIDPTPLTKRPTGGFQITVVDYGRGANANFRVGGLNSQSLVEELRGYIQARTGVPTGLHLLAYSSKALIDGNSLGSYGIEEGATIKLLLSAKGGGAAEQPVIEAGGYISQSTAQDPGTHSWASELALKSRVRVVSTKYLEHLGIEPPPPPEIPDVNDPESKHQWAKKVISETSLAFPSRAETRNPKLAKTQANQ